VDAYVQLLKGVGDPRIAERVDDLIDLERQVLLALSGVPEPAIDLPDAAILIADDLLPSQLMAVMAGRLAGIATARGGPTSHVAILAAALGLPAVVALGETVLAIEGGTRLILDAGVGALDIAPTPPPGPPPRPASPPPPPAGPPQGRGRRGLPDGGRDPHRGLRQPGSLADAVAAVAAGAEGCGLLRTEFLFMSGPRPRTRTSSTPPTRPSPTPSARAR